MLEQLCISLPFMIKVLHVQTHGLQELIDSKKKLEREGHLIYPIKISIYPI